MTGIYSLSGEESEELELPHFLLLSRSKSLFTPIESGSESEEEQAKNIKER